MILSETFNRLSRILEEQVANAIVELVEEQGINELDLKGDALEMCFYPHTMTKLMLNEHGIWRIIAIHDTSGEFIAHELGDNAVLPLPDLLRVLDEVEKYLSSLRD